MLYGMTKKQRWYEAGALVESGKRTKGHWPIRIITEGKGSSAIYTREMLEANKDVFANRPMFGNHPKDVNKPWERSPFEIKAKIGPTIEGREVDGVYGLYGEAIVDDEVDAFLEKFGDVTQISIFASGDGYEKDGETYAESFDGEDPYTSVDFVVAAGRGGKVERVLESFRALENGAAPADAGDHEREKRMDEAMKAYLEAFKAEVFAKMAELSTAIADATALVESVKSAQPERVEAVDAAGELATAVAEAHLGEKAVKRVLESVRDGKSVADAVQHEKEIRDEVLREAGSFSEGYFGSEGRPDEDYKITGLRFN
jgi:hypothetical protein